VFLFARLAVPDGAYTFMWRIPLNSAAIARPDGTRSIFVRWSSFLAKYSCSPHVRSYIEVCHISCNVHALRSGDFLH